MGNFSTGIGYCAASTSGGRREALYLALPQRRSNETLWVCIGKEEKYFS